MRDWEEKCVQVKSNRGGSLRGILASFQKTMHSFSIVIISLVSLSWPVVNSLDHSSSGPKRQSRTLKQSGEGKDSDGRFMEFLS